MTEQTEGRQAGHGALLKVLRDSAALRGLSLAEWDTVLPAARASRLLSRLAVEIRDREWFEHIPQPVERHLQAALTLAEQHERSARWGVRCLSEALRSVQTPLILLKGPAYLMLGLPNTKGRIYNDVDILVPRSNLDRVEATLREHGWTSLEMTEHQERYYRRWLHELPAMIHQERGIRVDVHHNILPEIDRIKVDAQGLIDAAQPVPGDAGLMTLAPADMMLHCATHIFRRGDYRNGLRDFVDIDDLLRHFAARAGFWDDLTARAEALGLTLPLHLAVRNARRFLGTPVPDTVVRKLAAWRQHWPPPPVLDWLIDGAVLPPDLSGRNRRRVLAHWLLARYPLSLWSKSIRPKIERLTDRGA